MASRYSCITLFILSLCLSMSSCRHKTGAKETHHDIGLPDTVIYEPQWAEGFRIDGWKDRRSTILTVTNPWQGAKDVEYQLLIVRDGEEVPDWYEGQVFPHNHAKSIVTMSSSHVAMLDIIGEEDAITGVSGKDFIMSQNIKDRKDEVVDIGYDGNIDYEALVGINPEIVLLYGVAGPSAMEPKLKELGIPYIYIGDHVEQNPVGKAEWVIAVNELCRHYHTFEHFYEISHTYDCIKAEMDSCTERRPKVMLNSPYNGVWFMPSVNNYMVRLIEDAGGDYIYKRNTSGFSQPIDMEEAYALMQEADIWINPGTATGMKELLSQMPRLADAPCVKNGKVYNNNLRMTPGGGNDFFESGVMKPGIILCDLIHIFHPSVAEGWLPSQYYRKLE